jgi:hypothetical protein
MGRGALRIFAFVVVSVAFNRAAIAGNTQWVATGSLGFPRENGSAVTLLDGRVFVAGGDGYPSSPASATGAEIYSPAKGTWSYAAAVPVTLQEAVVLRMADGKVLVASACGGGGTSANNDAIYDPNYDTWSLPAPVNFGHDPGAALLLADGTPFLVGGGCGPGAGCEIFDAAMDRWLPTASLATARFAHIAQALPDGRVLVAGGAVDAVGSLATSEIYDPKSDAWSSGPPLSTPRRNPVAARLPDGRVLVVGGGLFASGAPSQALASAEIFDPKTNTFAPTASMAAGRWNPSVTTLPDGRVLVIGGTEPTTNAPVPGVEIYDPATSTWRVTSPLLTTRTSPSVAPLPGGKVIVAGGSVPGVLTPLASAEIYSADCASGAACGGAACVDGFCCDFACTGPCVACAAAEKGAGGDGFCGPRPAGTAPPGGGCAATSASTCGTTGACGANGACAVYPADTVCAPAVCADDVSVQKASMCDGSGACRYQGTLACEPSRCEEGACATPCVVNSDCIAGDRCASGVCQPALQLGSACASDGACASGACADGVCCSSACPADGCHACTAAHGAPADGTCVALSGTACDDGNACTTGDVCKAGSCAPTDAVACPMPRACHGVGTCDPKTGACSTPTLADGVPCDDGDLCTKHDVCAGGACRGLDPVVCAQPTCGETPSCVPSTGLCGDAPDGGSISCGGCGDAGCADASPPDAGRVCDGGDGCRAQDASAGSPDASLAGDAASDAPVPVANGGCGCRAARDAPAQLAPAIGALVVGSLGARRRRRARR